MKLEYFKNINKSFLNIILSKIILICGFILILYNIHVLYFHIPKGYVADIYTNLPLSFYIASIFCYLLGSLIILSNRGTIRKFGIFLLILNHAVILLIPYMLGYYSMGRSDDMSYIGEYRHIYSIGHISDWDIYPASHIIGASISLISNLAVNIVSLIIPIVFSFIFIAGMILLCKFFFNEKKILDITICSSFIFYLGPYNFLNVPHALFFAYMPLFILIILFYLKNIKIEFIILAIIPLLLVPFMHPFIVFFASLFLIYFLIFNRILNLLIKCHYQRVFQLALILLIAFFTWFIYFTTLLISFKISLIKYFQKITENVFIETVENIEKIHLDMMQLLKLLFIYYGRYIIPLFFIIIGCFIIYYNKNLFIIKFKKQFIYFLILYIYLVIIMTIIFLNPIITHEPDRLTNLNFIVFAQIPLFVISILIINENIKSTNRRALIFLILFGCFWSLSLFGTFDSPNICRPNVALTYNEVKSMKWFYEKRDNDNIIVPLSQIGRFHSLFDDRQHDNGISIPDHFGYNSSYKSFVDNNYLDGKEIYIIILSIDEILYQEIPGYINVGRYNQIDFARFRNDNSINAKIYDNTNIEIYKIF